MQGYPGCAGERRDLTQRSHDAIASPVAEIVELAQSRYRIGRPIAQHEHAIGGHEIPRQAEVLAPGIDESARIERTIDIVEAIEPNLPIRKALAGNSSQDRSSQNRVSRIFSRPEYAANQSGVLSGT